MRQARIDADRVSVGGWRSGLALCLCLLTAALTGCASIDQPYVFAEQGVAPAAAASAPLPAASAVSLPSAIAMSREAQRQWAASARGESDRKRAVSAGLIGLSAIALFKGVTHPNVRDLAGLGAVSAGVYAWGNSMTSSARNAIYREGIASMSCAVEVVAPFDGPAWNGTSTQAAWWTLADNARNAESAIEGKIDLVKPLNVSRMTPVPARTLPAACAQLSTAACTGAPAGSPQAQLCERLKSDCVPRAASSVEVKPHPALPEALARADAELDNLRKTIQEASELEGLAWTAGAWLWRTGVEIEQRVREGIEKTEPDLATVLSVSQALKSPPAVPAATAKTDTDATGDSGAPTPKAGERFAAKPPDGVDALNNLVDSGRRARGLLERRIAVLRSALINSRSESCRRVLPLSFQTVSTATPSGSGNAGPPAVTPTPVNGANTVPRTLPAN